MEDGFRNKVGAAAGAAWWTCLVGAAFVTVQWLVYRRRARMISVTRERDAAPRPREARWSSTESMR
jgi:hypothetical protein